MPKLTEDFVPGVVSLTTLHKVLQNLLAERVSIRDMRTIVETLAEHAPAQSDPYELTTVVRVALGRAITQQWFPGNGEIQVIGLDTQLERLLLQALQGGGGLEPGLADRLLDQARRAAAARDAQRAAGAAGQPCAAGLAGAFPAPQSAADRGVVQPRNQRRSPDSHDVDHWSRLMKRCLFVLCLLAPLTAGAVSGSWVAEGGVTLEQGGMRDESAGLRPPNALPDANARITRVSWRYRLLGPEPVGLQAQLCTVNRCIPLGGGSGSSNGLQGEPANAELRFVYYVQSQGGLNPPLRVIGNQVIVNYE